MCPKALVFVIFSALMHASYNFTFKKSLNKTIYLWSMFAFSIFLMVGFTIFTGKIQLLLPPIKILILASLAAIFFTLYQLFTGKAYALSEGDLSIVYPLSITAPLYIPFLAYILIGEKTSPVAFLGIVIVLVGTYMIQLNTSIKSIKLKKIDFSKKHIQYALFAGFIYSFGAIVDKIGVGRHEFFTYTFWVVIFMFTYMTLNILFNRRLKPAMFSCFKNPLFVATGGILLTLSFLSYRYAMQLAPVSLTAGIRQISSLFGVLLGVFILKEPYGAIRFVSSILIFIGILIIYLSK
ncbi:DMT family transporter [Hippea jasoniae]|uniref:DMT family transporter n=1 Tax=Hippea jasoniae TaxID=944479 RepID=UPI0005586712|nr:EamA family transporter [Hippea jasoniae]